MMFDLTRSENDAQPRRKAKYYGPYSRPCAIFMAINNEGRLFLGMGYLVLSPTWTGSLAFYETADEAVDEAFDGNLLYCQVMGCVPQCGCFLKMNGQYDRVTAGNDSGEITVYSAVNDDGRWALVPQHKVSCSSQIRSLDQTECERFIAVGQSIGTISLHDSEILTPVKIFENAHSMPVTKILRTLDESSMFASTSFDGSALLWDVRLSRPACAIYEQHECVTSALTSMSWKNNFELAVSSTRGVILFFDIRTRGPYDELRFSRCPPRILSFQRDTGALAMTNTTNTVMVWDSKSRRIVYTDERHEIRAKDISWHSTNPTKLYSCGLDGMVYSHDIEV